jgi:rRNA-processing protein FCF1
VRDNAHKDSCRHKLSINPGSFQGGYFHCIIIVDPSDDDVDDSLVRLALLEGMVLGTTDSELRRKARTAGVKVLYLRQKSYLVLDG